MLASVYTISSNSFKQQIEMATYYSILNAQIRPEIKEQLSIGFILMDERSIYFSYSKTKLGVAKELLTSGAYHLLKDCLKNIEAKVESENSFLEKSKGQILIDNKMVQRVFTEEYFIYLSRYNSNVITIAEPKKIDVMADTTTFQKLFKKFVDGNEIAKSTTHLKTFETFKTANHEKLQKHYNIDIEITNQHLSNLIAPVRLDFIGQNERTVFIQNIDFERPIYHIENDLAQIIFLQKALDEKKKANHPMVITNEPNKSEFKKQHEVWNQLRQRNDLQNVDVSESEKTLEYAEEHGVEPYVV
jgi:hypothetical protein